MKQHPTRTLPHRPLWPWLCALLLGAACQGTGHVRELAPAEFPEEAPAPSRVENHDEHGEPRFAAPPAADVDVTRERLAPTEAPRSETPSADSAAEPQSAEHSDDLSRSEPLPPVPLGGSAAPNDSPARAEAKASSGRSGGMEPQSANPAAQQSRGWREHTPTRRRPRAEERPGLATHWGEDRYSPARVVDFERADRSHPSAVVEVHYNDRAGASSMLPDGWWGRAEKQLDRGISVRIVDAAGQTLPALVRGSRVVAVGAPGDRYMLVIENPTPQRFEVVASVDGLDVLDGEAARVEKRGYLVSAYSSVSIDGFRRSEAEVAAFRLGNVSRSYAASKGQARNVGVLGFAFFDERRAPVPEPGPWYAPVSEDTRLRRGADPFPGNYAQPPVW